VRYRTRRSPAEAEYPRIHFEQLPKPEHPPALGVAD